EDLGQKPCGLSRTMRRLEVRPDRRKWVAEVPQQIRENLPYGLWFPRELGQIVSVVDGALAEALARMADACAVVADDRDGARTDMHDQITPGPSDTAPSSTRRPAARGPAGSPSRPSSPRRQTAPGLAATRAALR